MSEEPTFREVLFRLDTLVTQMTTVAKELREDRLNAAATFVRKDWYSEARKADQASVSEVGDDVKGLQEDSKRNAEFKRQIGLALAIALVGVLGSLGVSIFVLLAGGSP